MLKISPHPPTPCILKRDKATGKACRPHRYTTAIPPTAMPNRLPQPAPLPTIRRTDRKSPGAGTVPTSRYPHKTPPSGPPPAGNQNNHSTCFPPHGTQQCPATPTRHSTNPPLPPTTTNKPMSPPPASPKQGTTTGVPPQANPSNHESFPYTLIF